MRIKNLSQIKQLLPSRFIERDLFGKVISDLPKREIQIIYGPRQVGKSSLIYAVMQKIFTKNCDIFYFNLDYISEIFNSPEVFIADIGSKKQSNKRTFIFIDEIQRKKDIGLFLKYIYDKKLNYKFIVTGSTSLNIKNIVSEPLTGRKYEYFLAPLSLNEIIKANNINIAKLKKLTPSLNSLIDNYLLFGGYPEVVLAKTPQTKIKKLTELASSYITRDLTNVFNITQEQKFKNCAIYLSQNISNLLSKENIAKTLSLSVHAVNNYLEALVKSYIIILLPPFYTNPVKEVSHRPKLYFLDNGIRNILLQKTSASLILSDKGKLFEQTTLQHLRLRYEDKVKYWRNINQTEVDFIIKTADKILAIETKYSFTGKKRLKNLESFKKNYKSFSVETLILSKENLPQFL